MLRSHPDLVGEGLRTLCFNKFLEAILMCLKFECHRLIIGSVWWLEHEEAHIDEIPGKSEECCCEYSGERQGSEKQVRAMLGSLFSFKLMRKH